MKSEEDTFWRPQHQIFVRAASGFRIRADARQGGRCALAAGIWRRWPRSRRGNNRLRQELAASSARQAAVLVRHFPASGALLKSGTRGRRRKHHLPTIASGLIRGVRVFRRNARSDLASLQTRAERNGDDLYQRPEDWTSYAKYADRIFAWCARCFGGSMTAFSFILFDMVQMSLNQADPFALRRRRSAKFCTSPGAPSPM